MANELVRASDVNVDELKRIGALMAQCGYFDKSGSAEQQIAQMAVKVMAGREMGYGPFASVQGIHVIQGKPALSANLMAAAVKASARYDYRVRKMNATLCEIEFFERTATGGRESLGVSSFTIAEAKAAQVKNLDKFPRNMLFARAMSNGVKWYCPDVFNGNAVYVPEELGANVDGEGNVIDVSYSVVTEVTATNGGAAHTNGTVANATNNQPSAEGARRTENSNGGVGNGTKVLGIVSPVTFKHLHAAGASLYGNEWDAKRHVAVSWVTNNRTSSSKELYEAEAQRLIDIIEEKRRQEVAAVTVADAEELNPFDEPAEVPA